MPKLLDRYLAGWNEIYEAIPNVAERPGVFLFSEVADSLRLTPEELSPVLKIPLDKLKEHYQSNNGYISGDAINNLRAYIEAKNAVADFCRCQHGELEVLANGKAA